MYWIIMRRNKGAKDEITYSFFNGDMTASVASNMFERLEACACLYGDYENAKEDCSLLAKQGFDVSVEVRNVEKER